MILAALLAAAVAEEPFTLKLHLLADDPRVRLERDGTSLCGTPCNLDLEVHPGDRFRFAGDGLSESAAFHFFPRAGDVTLQVRAGKVDYRNASIGAGVLGTASVGTGVFLLLLGGLETICISDSTGVCTSQRQSASNHALLGAGLLGAGLALGGLALATARAGRTTWQSDRGAEPWTASVHLEARSGVELWRGDERICSAPCDQPVVFRPNDELRFAGEGVATSSSFTPEERQLNLRVNPGSAAGRALGLTLAVGGLAGGYLELLTFGRRTGGPNAAQWTVVGGALGAAIVGVILTIANTTTWEAVR